MVTFIPMPEDGKKLTVEEWWGKHSRKKEPHVPLSPDSAASHPAQLRTTRSQGMDPQEKLTAHGSLRG